MSVRMRVAIVSLGVVAVACSAAPTSGESSQPPNAPVGASAPATVPAPDPGERWLRVTPQEGVRGGTLSLDVACLDNLGTVRSPALDIGAVQPDPAGHQPWHRTGSATIRPDAEPGPHQISTTCGTETLSTTFTVVIPHHHH